MYRKVKWIDIYVTGEIEIAVGESLGTVWNCYGNLISETKILT